MGYNLRDDAEERSSDERARAEHKIWVFLRWFLPAIGPLLIYIGVEAAVILLGSVVIHPYLSRPEFLRQKMTIYTSVGVIITFLLLRRYSRKRCEGSGSAEIRGGDKASIADKASIGDKAGGGDKADGGNKAGIGLFEDATLYLRNPNLLKCAGALIFGVCSAFAISSLITLLPKVGPVEVYLTHLGRIYENWGMYVGVLFNTFLTPLVEEVIFRGYMLNRLLPHFGEKWALITTSLLFSLLHGTAIWVLYAFVMGWIMGKVSIDEDNILYAVLLHIGFNLPSSMLWFIYLHVPGSYEALNEAKIAVLMIGLFSLGTALLIYQAYQMERSSHRISRFIEEIRYGIKN